MNIPSLAGGGLILSASLAVLALVLLLPKPAAASQVESVSLLRLIAAPEKYDGKNVRVMGYMHLEFEGNGLYVHKEDYVEAITKNGVWLVNAQTEKGKDLNDNYVLIEGTFDASDHGHRGMWSGGIKDIRRMELWGQKAFGPARPKPKPSH